MSKRLSTPLCPTCNSHDPKLHPAIAFEGEVQLCRNPWHKPTAEQIEADQANERWKQETRT